jgi:hypothetical protein
VKGERMELEDEIDRERQQNSAAFEPRVGLR